MESYKIKNHKGFILIGITFIMLLIGVTSVALNRKAGLQSKMTQNQNQKARTALGQQAALEHAMWKLTSDPMWWTDTASKNYTDDDGVTYARTVQKSTVGGYTDATTVSVTAPGSTITASASFRYYIHSPFSASDVTTPIHQLDIDGSGYIYFAVRDEHVIRKLDPATADITTVAGTGSMGDSGDGGLATSAELNRPRGIAVDSNGDLYIADTGNHKVKKVTAATGIITTIAGTGTAGYSGDSGPPASAALNSPHAVVLYGGDVFIADTGNHCVREIDTSQGKIGTNAGTCELAGSAGDGAKAVNAELNTPMDIVFNAGGDYFIADSGNHRVRKVRNDSNRHITTIAGTGFAGDPDGGGLGTSATLRRPCGVAASGDHVYIADTDNHVIRKLTPVTPSYDGDISTVGGTGSVGYSGDGGQATSASLDKPVGIGVDSSGRLAVADSNNTVIRRIVEGGTVSSLFTSGGIGLNTPGQMALATSGNLYVADAENHQVRKVTPAGTVSIVAGTGSAGYDVTDDGADATDALLNSPKGIAVDGSENLYISDTGNHCIRKVTNSTGNISTIAGTCEQNGDTGNGGAATSAKLDSPEGIYIDDSGNIYVADTVNCWIRKFTEGGNIDRYAGADSGGHVCGSSATALALTTQLQDPQDFSMDSNGNGYIADTGNSKIWKVDGSGNISVVAGTGTAGYTGDGALAVNAQIDSPSSVFLDSSDNLYFTDVNQHVVRAVSTHNDYIYTLAGSDSGESGYNGNDQVAVVGLFDAPVGLEMASGRGGRRVYISDSNNNRIRVLEYELEIRLD